MCISYININNNTCHVFAKFPSYKKSAQGIKCSEDESDKKNAITGFFFRKQPKG